MKSKVNFFIVGAPKCGTTALANALNKHSKIFIPEVKEPHYFCKDWPQFQRYRDLTSYESLYERDCELKGDASVWYLYSSTAFKHIRNYNERAKIIVCVREPWEMLPSLHNQLIFSGREPEKSFEKAWGRTKLDLEKISESQAVVREHLDYKNLGFYLKNINKFQKEFGRENVFVVSFSDIKERSGHVISSVLDFLEVEAEDVKIEKDNASRQHKFPMITQFLINPPPWAKILKRMIKRLIFKDQGKSHLRRFYAFMSKPAKKAEIPESVYADMIQRFHEDWKQVKNINDCP